VIDESKLLKRDGDVLAVLRPSDPQRALEKARLAKTQEDMDKVLLDPTQTYTFVGLASLDAKILDPATGENLGDLRPGDSFVPFEHVKALPRPS